MTDPTVSIEELKAFLLTREADPTTKKAQQTAKRKAEGLWFQLLIRCRKDGSLFHLLVVRCPKCNKTADDCACHRKQIDGDGNPYWSHHHGWVFDRQELIQLQPDDLLHKNMVTSTRANVMAFVDHLKSTT